MAWIRDSTAKTMGM
ncbi:hypothetical protein [Janthinobacterium sp. PSPC2-1]